MPYGRLRSVPSDEFPRSSQSATVALSRRTPPGLGRARYRGRRSSEIRSSAAARAARNHLLDTRRLRVLTESHFRIVAHVQARAHYLEPPGVPRTMK